MTLKFHVSLSHGNATAQLLPALAPSPSTESQLQLVDGKVNEVSRVGCVYEASLLLCLPLHLLGHHHMASLDYKADEKISVWVTGCYGFCLDVSPKSHALMVGLFRTGWI